MYIHYSEDFKISVVAAVKEESLSRRKAAKRFGVSVASSVSMAGKTFSWRRRGVKDERGAL